MKNCTSDWVSASAGEEHGADGSVAHEEDEWIICSFKATGECGLVCGSRHPQMRHVRQPAAASLHELIGYTLVETCREALPH